MMDKACFAADQACSAVEKPYRMTKEMTSATDKTGSRKKETACLSGNATQARDNIGQGATSIRGDAYVALSQGKSNVNREPGTDDCWPTAEDCKNGSRATRHRTLLCDREIRETCKKKTSHAGTQ
jgi:hypothetical protein